MQKKFIISYLFIFFTLLCMMSLSRPATEKSRGGIVRLLAPMWQGLAGIKTSFFRSRSAETQFEQTDGSVFSAQEELLRLQLDNQLLHNHLQAITGLLDQLNLLNKKLMSQEPENKELKLDEDSYQAYIKRIEQQIKYESKALPARVIFRSLDAWNHALWINIGEADNQTSNKKIIVKNSPVLSGNSVIGLVDYVGQNQSRVRLITDPRLTPSVRAARGGEQESLIADHIEFLIYTLDQKKYSMLSTEEYETLEKLLKQIKRALKPFKKSWYLAKGELQGSVNPLTRQVDFTIKGTGFNYDFSDEEGEGRDLRTGKIINQPTSTPVPILKLNDLLVTTGMDGVFPPGLKVAVVTKIELLKEGDFYYELEAKPTAGNLNDLSLVFVIPPLGYDGDDHD